jgi:hypothetical protein
LRGAIGGGRTRGPREPEPAQAHGRGLVERHGEGELAAAARIVRDPGGVE